MSYGPVRIESPNGLSADTKITDAKTGTPITGVCRLQIDLEAPNPATVVLELVPGPFLLVGRPEVRGELAALIPEIREAAAEAYPLWPGWWQAMGNWADRLERALAAATGLTLDPPPRI